MCSILVDFFYIHENEKLCNYVNCSHNRHSQAIRSLYLGSTQIKCFLSIQLLLKIGWDRCVVVTSHACHAGALCFSPTMVFFSKTRNDSVLWVASMADM